MNLPKKMQEARLLAREVHIFKKIVRNADMAWTGYHIRLIVDGKEHVYVSIGNVDAALDSARLISRYVGARISVVHVAPVGGVGYDYLHLSQFETGILHSQERKIVPHQDDHVDSFADYDM